MVEQVLFLVSAVVSHFYLVKVISILVGHSLKVPIPILCIVGGVYNNTYIATPALAYQIYFWANYFNIFAV